MTTDTKTAPSIEVRRPLEFTDARLDARIPGGPIERKWEQRQFDVRLVNPTNKRRYTVIVVGSGLAGASASAGTAGASAGASGGQHDASTVSTNFYKGMAIFTVAKGGLMYEASIGGQKFTFTPARR